MIYLIDTIGKETGMHLYDAAFKNCFEKHGKEVRILSNYIDKDTSQPLIQNFYHGNKLYKIYNLLSSIFQMWMFYAKHKKGNIWIYQSNMQVMRFLNVWEEELQKHNSLRL